MKKLLVLLCVLFAVPAWGVTEILLTVQEPTNHARTNGPVTSGIPLASGQQTSTWSLWKDGVEVPVGITPLDGASNWILLDFQTTVGAYSSETYILKDTSASASAPTLNKTEDASTITVDTGTSGAKWTIDKTNFDGFDGVYFDADSNGFTEGDRLITDNSAQITADDVETTNTYVTSRTDTATFAWEYDNAMRKTLKVTGQWYEGANPWAGAFYTVRFTWYAGRTDCLVEFIFRNSRNGDITHRKVDVLEFILSGASKTTVTATTSGSIEWEDVDSNGILWDLIPDSIYWNSGSQVDSSTNGGMVLLDWSHYSSILVIDADTTLSAGEKTAKDGAAKAPLFALAEPSRYSDHGEMSTRNHGTFEDERRSYRVWDWMYDAGNGNATGWDHPGTDGADEPKDVCATGTNNSIPTDWDSYCYGAGSSCCDPLTWETMSPHADMENPHLWHHIIMYVGGTRSIPEQEIGQRSYWDRARGWARYCKEQFAFRTDGFDWNWNTNYSQSTTANRGEGQCTVSTGEPPCDFNPTTADDTMLYNALEKYGQGRVCSPGRITDSGEGSPSGYFDDQGADHMFCWALADYYLLTGDTDAYDALGDLNEMSQYIFHDGKVPGSFAMSTGRREGRHLSAATRWTEISGEDATFRDKMFALIDQTTNWNGTYNIWIASGYISAIHLAEVTHAVYLYYEVTGDTDAVDYLTSIATWASNYGVDDTYGVTGKSMQMDTHIANDVWHQCIDGYSDTFYDGCAKHCVGAADEGEACTTIATCDIAICDGGDNHGDPCSTQEECAPGGGTCIGRCEAHYCDNSGFACYQPIHTGAMVMPFITAYRVTGTQSYYDQAKAAWDHHTKAQNAGNNDGDFNDTGEPGNPYADYDTGTNPGVYQFANEYYSGGGDRLLFSENGDLYYGNLLFADTDPIPDIGVNYWYEVPNSNAIDVAPCTGLDSGSGCSASNYFPGQPGDPTQACYNSFVNVSTLDFKHSFTGWNSAGFDRHRNRIIHSGGGHGGWAGDGIYVFDLDELGWSRVRDDDCIDPSGSSSCNFNWDDQTGGCPGMQHCPYLITDGDTDTDQTCDDADTDAVRQVHNYGSMTYVPELDEMCNIGRSALSATAGSSYSNDLICWAFDTKTWVVHNDAYGWGISAAATVERDTGKVWSSGASSAGDKAFASWVPSTDTWTQHIANNSKIFGAFIAIDETNDYLVEVGGGSGETHNCNTRGRDLSDPTDPISVLTASTPGGTPSDPGMCCCPVAVCVGGSNDGNPCCDDEDCPGGDPVDNCDGCGWESQEYMPGFAWDPTIGKNVGWNLTGTVYTFEDPGGTNTWNTVTHNGATVPAFTSGLGAAGKWWYSDQDNIFGASHQADHNVFLYRLNADPNGATPPVSNVEGAAVSGGSFE